MGSVPKLSIQQSTIKQQLNPNSYQNKNKKLRRRLLLALAFMLPLILSAQYSIYQQQKMIKEKQILISKEKHRLSSLKKVGQSLEKDIKTLTESEEGILKFARKLYGFSKPDETIFQIIE
ncbi:septum formation initiator family protein [Bacillus clarus]|uniref:Septum formation initiator family protein n=1 Tax=Bacillus clarus TaxID=2338372 RepID=A0A090YTN6_9BACI|nr:septum formation initiator family protein [Bacillus clarus]KFN01567.1 septum formation initiator family protein [Bacillus clarus]RFT67671.1 septum formation initiator family protein [Bacillus clarus]